MGRRLLGIWFPRLASEVSQRRRPVEGPFALVRRVGNADQLHCLNADAQGQGLHRGMALANARAICPDLCTRPADPVAETAALASLRRWAMRYSPLVARDGEDGLLADITGAAHLFGGEAELLADLQDGLSRAGLSAVAGIAGTRAAAHALARHGGGIVPDGQLMQGVMHLPVQALRIDAATAAALGRAGLTHVSDLAALPRAPLARRFGVDLMVRLDQLLGHQPEPVAAEPEAPHFGVRLTLPEPIGLTADVMAGLERLLDRLCDHLSHHQHGARRLRLDLSRVDRETLTVEIGLARAMRDPDRMAALFARGLDDIDAGFGIEAMRLTAPVTEALAPGQIVMGQAGQGADAMADLLSRLGNRLGFDAVLRFLPMDSLIPERSFQLAAAAYSCAARGFGGSGPARPLRLFPPRPVAPTSDPRPGTPPAGFSWQGQVLTTLRAAGPERIAPEWWLDDPDWRTGLRDYWRIQTHQGPRLWLFHTPQDPGWQVAGEFA